MKAPEPLVISWRGRQLRVRHDDPHLGPYSSSGATVRSAVELATDVEGLRLVLMTAVGDRYRVRVSDDGSVVGLWRRRHLGAPSAGPQDPATLGIGRAIAVRSPSRRGPRRADSDPCPA